MLFRLTPSCGFVVQMWRDGPPWAELGDWKVYRYDKPPHQKLASKEWPGLMLQREKLKKTDREGNEALVLFWSFGSSRTALSWSSTEIQNMSTPNQEMSKIFSFLSPLVYDCIWRALQRSACSASALRYWIKSSQWMTFCSVSSISHLCCRICMSPSSSKRFSCSRPCSSDGSVLPGWGAGGACRVDGVLGIVKNRLARKGPLPLCKLQKINDEPRLLPHLRLWRDMPWEKLSWAMAWGPGLKPDDA